MYKNLGTRVAESVVKDVEYLAKEEKTDKSKILRELLSDAVRRKIMEIALEKYSQRRISLGRAAELARMPLADFMKMAAERKIPMDYSLESLEEDFKAAAK